MKGRHCAWTASRVRPSGAPILRAGSAAYQQPTRDTPGRAVDSLGGPRCKDTKSTYVALQDQVVDQVDDLSHGGFFPPLPPGRVRKLNGLAIA